MRTTYTNNGDGSGYTVWLGGTRLGRVMRYNSVTWAAYAPDGKQAGTTSSMGEAGARLRERAGL